jgi:hypothetical protein
MKIQLKYDGHAFALRLSPDFMSNLILNDLDVTITLLYVNNFPIKIHPQSFYTFPEWKLIEDIIQES